MSTIEPMAPATPRLRVIVDTREKRPLPLERFARVEVQTKGLKVADYSLAGFEDRVGIERKSLDDLVHSLTSHRDRFFREMGKLARYSFRAIVVESDFDLVLSGDYVSNASTKAVLAAVMAIEVDYGIPVRFCGSRPGAARWVACYLAATSKRLGGAAVDVTRSSRPR